MECCGLHYNCDINYDECYCIVNVYADEYFENYVDSFEITGEYNYYEETYYERAYDNLFDMADWYKGVIERGHMVVNNPCLPPLILR